MEGACGFDGCGIDSSLQAGHPSGYYRATPTILDKIASSPGHPDGYYVNYSGYSNWEKSILETLYADGGTEGVWAAQYIVENNIHIEVGEPFEYHETIGIGYFTGDWQTLGDISAWYEGDDLVVLNPNSGYSEDTLPRPWGISIVAHEALHISQGWRARTKRGEMEAWQFGLRIFETLGGDVSGLRNSTVMGAQTVNEFVSAIRTYDSGYWFGLQFYPPWFAPYDRFP
jgi:hypothetical protein